RSNQSGVGLARIAPLVAPPCHGLVQIVRHVVGVLDIVLFVWGIIVARKVPVLYHFRVSSHGVVIILPCATPRSPSPDIIPVGEEVRVFALLAESTRKRRTAHRHYERVIAVLFKELRTESEEPWTGKRIIFKDNAFFHMLEKPGNGS